MTMSNKADEITDRLVSYAWRGYPEAMRIRLSRMAPPRKGRPSPFAMPKVETLADVKIAATAIIQGVADGELTPPEAADLFQVLDRFERRHAKPGRPGILASLERLLTGNK
jgi:hypothetical protein